MKSIEHIVEDNTPKVRVWVKASFALHVLENYSDLDYPSQKAMIGALLAKEIRDKRDAQDWGCAAVDYIGEEEE
jgi:hypothetical protein